MQTMTQCSRETKHSLKIKNKFKEWLISLVVIQLKFILGLGNPDWLCTKPFLGSIFHNLWRSWCWERLKAEGEEDDRGWDGWVASPTWWTWVWASSGRQWRTGKPGVLQVMESQRVGHDRVTERQQSESRVKITRPKIIFSLRVASRKYPLTQVSKYSSPLFFIEEH